MTVTLPIQYNFFTSAAFFDTNHTMFGANPTDFGQPGISITTSGGPFGKRWLFWDSPTWGLGLGNGDAPEARATAVQWGGAYMRWDAADYSKHGFPFMTWGRMTPSVGQHYGDGYSLVLGDNGRIQLYATIDSSPSLVAQSGTGAFALNKTQRVEWTYHIDEAGTTGAVDLTVFVDNALVLSVAAGTLTTTFAEYLLGPFTTIGTTTTSLGFKMAHPYVICHNVTYGESRNGPFRLGNWAAYDLRPIANITHQWTGGGYTDMDDATDPDGAATQITSPGGVPHKIDTYDLSDLPSDSGSVEWVLGRNCAQKVAGTNVGIVLNSIPGDPTSNSVCLFTDLNITNTDYAYEYANYSQSWDWSGSAIVTTPWTAALVNALQGGPADRGGATNATQFVVEALVRLPLPTKKTFNVQMIG